MVVSVHDPQPFETTSERMGVVLTELIRTHLSKESDLTGKIPRPTSLAFLTSKSLASGCLRPSAERAIPTGS